MLMDVKDFLLFGQVGFFSPGKGYNDLGSH